METQPNQRTGNSVEDYKEGKPDGAKGDNAYAQRAGVKEAWSDNSVVAAADKVRGGSQRKSDTRNAWLKSLTEFAQDVSVVGLRYVANASSSSFRRSVWLLLIVIGAGFTSYQIVTRIQRYASHPVNVIVRVKRQHEMRFPTVTICNENRAFLAKVARLGK